MDSQFAAYLTFAFLFAVTPGGTTALVVRNTLGGGRRAGLATAAGAASANGSYAAATGLGLAVVLARWPSAFELLRIGGACYLGWLGGQSVWRAVHRPDGGVLMLSDADSAERPRTLRPSYRQGLTFNLLNPSIAGFYLTIVPSFLPANAPPARFALLAGSHVVMAFTCHAAWAVALHRVRRLMTEPWKRRALEAATGLALLGLAVRLLL